MPTRISVQSLAQPSTDDSKSSRLKQELVEARADAEKEPAPKPRLAVISEFGDPLLRRPNFDSLWVLASEDGLRTGSATPVHQTCLIGRGSECHVRIRDGAVSRTHALVERSENGVVLVDMNSTNGVLLNGKRLEGQATLKNRDRIQIARTVFDVVLV